MDLLIDNAFQGNMVYYCITYKYLGQELTEYLDNHKQDLDFDQQYQLAINAAYLIYLIHSKSIAHLDIKPNNFTIDENCKLHLIDFGESERNIDEKTKYKGTDHYLSNNFKSLTKEQLDIYALLLVLAGGEKNYKNKDLEPCIFKNDIINNPKSPIYYLRNLIGKDGNYHSKLHADDILVILIMGRYGINLAEDQIPRTQ